MVVTDYLPYKDIYASIIRNYIIRQYELKYPYVILGTETDNFIELVCEYTHHTKKQLYERYKNITFKNIHYIISSKDFYKESSSIGIFHHMIYSLMENHILQKDELYEFTNYIINNFKVNNDFQNIIYNNIPNVEEAVNRVFVENMNKYMIDTFLRDFIGDNYRIPINVHILDNDLNYCPKQLLCLCISMYKILYPSLEFNYNNLRNYADVHYAHTEISELDKDKVCSEFLDVSIRCNKQMRNGEDIEDIDYNKFRSMRKSIKRYDNDISIKPMYSFYSNFIDILDCLEQRSIHKLIMNGINDKSIISMKCMEYVNENKSRLSDFEIDTGIQLPLGSFDIDVPTYSYNIITGKDDNTQIYNLLRFILSKNICISGIYTYNSLLNDYSIDFHKIYEYILNNDLRIKNILKHEYLLLKNYFNYGELDENHIEAILIRS